LETNAYLHLDCFATVCETPKVLADHAALVSIASYSVGPASWLSGSYVFKRFHQPPSPPCASARCPSCRREQWRLPLSVRKRNRQLPWTREWERKKNEASQAFLSQVHAEEWGGFSCQRTVTCSRRKSRSSSLLRRLCCAALSLFVRSSSASGMG